MASIFKTPSGKYRAKISIPTDDGKYKQVSKSGFKTKTEAKAWATNTEAHKLDSKTVRQSNSLLSDYFERWYLTYKSDKELATIKQYENTLVVIKKYLHNFRLNDFDRNDFQSFINDFGRNHSRQTVMKRKNHISQCLRDAYADGIIQRDPTLRIIGAGNDGKRPELKFIEADELMKLNEYVKTRIQHDGYLAVFIGIHTGARYGEIMALDDGDLDRDNHTISISKSVDPRGDIKVTKTTASNRVIKIDDELFNVLKDIKGRYCVVSSAGANKTLKSALENINAKHITYHGLRHSHASFLLTKGVSINYVSERLGHSNIAVTQRVYAHLLNEQREKEEQKTINLF